MEQRKRMRKQSLVTATIMGVWFLAVFLVPGISYNAISSGAYFAVKVLTAWLVMFWIFVIVFYSNKNHEEPKYFLVQYATLILITFYVSIYFLVSYRLYTMKYQPNQNKEVSMIVSNKDTITTNQTLIYIGKTNSNVFLYDVNKKKSIVLKTSDIEKFEIKADVPWIRIP